MRKKFLIAQFNLSDFFFFFFLHIHIREERRKIRINDRHFMRRDSQSIELLLENTSYLFLRSHECNFTVVN
jgi:hypothetical protein